MTAASTLGPQALVRPYQPACPLPVSRNVSAMYEVVYFHRLRRDRLPISNQRFERLPGAPVMDERKLAEARSLNDPDDVWHWTGSTWMRGPLPGKSMKLHTP